MCVTTTSGRRRRRDTEGQGQTGKSVSSDLSYHRWNLPLHKEVLPNSYISCYNVSLCQTYISDTHKHHQCLPTTPPIINRTIQSKYPLPRSFFSYQIPITLTCSDLKSQSQCDFGQVLIHAVKSGSSLGSKMSSVPFCSFCSTNQRKQLLTWWSCSSSHFQEAC